MKVAARLLLDQGLPYPVDVCERQYILWKRDIYAYHAAFSVGLSLGEAS